MEEVKLPEITERTSEQIEENVPNELQHLPPDLQRAVHMYLSGSFRPKEIAGIINRAPSTVTKWLRKPEVINYINAVQREETEIVKQALKSLQLKAAYKLNDLLDSEDDAVALNTVKEILNRTGHVVTQEKNVKITHQTFEEKLKRLDENLIEEAEYTIIEED